VGVFDLLTEKKEKVATSTGPKKERGRGEDFLLLQKGKKEGALKLSN